MAYQDGNRFLKLVSVIYLLGSYFRWLVSVSETCARFLFGWVLRGFKRVWEVMLMVVFGGAFLSMCVEGMPAHGSLTVIDSAG